MYKKISNILLITLFTGILTVWYSFTYDTDKNNNIRQQNTVVNKNFNQASPQSDNDLCKEKITKITDRYNKMFGVEKFSFVMKTTITENGTPGEELVTNFWKNKNKFKIENPYMCMYQDEKYTIVILHDSKAIMLRNVDQGGRADPVLESLTTGQQIDSLLRYSKTISCKEKNYISVTFPEKINGQPNSLKIVKIKYDPGKKDIQNIEYEFYSKQGEKKQFVKYSGYTTSFSSDILMGTALNKIYSGNKIKEKYKTYKVTDLRSKK